MRLPKSLYLLLIVATISVSVSAQSFRKAVAAQSFPAESNRFHFTINGSVYTIYGTTGTARLRINRSKNHLKLPLAKDGWIASVKYLRYKNDLIILYENNYGGDGDSRILYLDLTTKRIKWSRQIPTFNIAGIVSQNFAYLAGVGYFSKLNLNTGKFGWKREDLFTDEFGKIDVPGNPTIKMKTVVFTEDGRIAFNRYHAPRRIVFDKFTGKIKRLYLN